MLHTGAWKSYLRAWLADFSGLVSPAQLPSKPLSLRQGEIHESPKDLGFGCVGPLLSILLLQLDCVR